VGPVHNHLLADILICVVKYDFCMYNFFVDTSIGFSCWTMILICIENFLEFCLSMFLVFS
jgi:hypothetical protein